MFLRPQQQIDICCFPTIPDRLNAMEAIRSSSSSQSYGASSSSRSSAPPAYETIYMGGARGSGSGSGSGLPAYNGSAFAGGPIVL